ncbi:MAG: RNA polymerase factor sigma-54 [Alphaproteobacteria bacterium]|jgi:RNA polymerase sigma-54 factor|nr:RNA polymerase factor sigma-54 [Alphaproteobacteria bacterium]
MAISQRLDLRQTQSLVMTPQLQQAIKLLQLSNIELSAFVEEELAENPMLEHDESEGDAPGDREREGNETGEEDAASADDVGSFDETGEAPVEAFDDVPAGPDTMELTAGESLPAEADKPLDMEYEEVWNDENPRDVADDIPSGFTEIPMGSGGRLDFGNTVADLEATLSDEPTLREHLLEQLILDMEDQIDRLIGIHLIDMLDEAGWLAGDPAAIAETLGCPVARVETVLEAVQQFDPPGVFARDLRECLALQLRDRDRLDPAMQALLDNLDLMAKRDKAGLIKACGVDEEDLAEMVVEIRALDPKPASNFLHDVVQTMTPDILMRPHPDGGWSLELNPETLPRVLVNTEYYARINGDARTKQDKEYINERFQSANWLVKSLHQRATTILKVAGEIALQQDAFFAYGVEHLKPLILRDIAEAIEMHESTVSRVTTNKFIVTPRGTFELKYFFTSAIQSVGGGDAHSAEAVRFRIKALIDEESPEAVLSDDRIVELLKRDGIDIARRTVAKYRGSMRISSSVERRRTKSGTL